MELSRVFAENPPKRGIVGFWPGHSMGRYAGSARYADRNWLDLRENGIAYLHIDLNGLGGADNLWAQHMTEVGDGHLDVLEEGPLSLGVARDDSGSSAAGVDRDGTATSRSGAPGSPCCSRAPGSARTTRTPAPSAAAGGGTPRRTLEEESIST
jgi:hypothetical protein